MHSFLFPEDLDPLPIRTIECIAPLQASKAPETLPVPSTRRRPVPIILPPTYQYDAVNYDTKDEVVVSVTRLSLDERSPRLQKFMEKKASALTRWKSATLSRTDKEDRNARMALAEAERVAHAVARADSSLRPRRQKAQLSTLAEENDRDGSHSPMDYGFHHVVF